MRKIMLLMFACVMFTSCSPKIENYPLSTVVIEVNHTDDSVIVEDYNGNQWEFWGAEDWHEGDICAMIMDTKDTTTIYDDEIISKKYCGTIDKYRNA